MSHFADGFSAPLVLLSVSCGLGFTLATHDYSTATARALQPTPPTHDSPDQPDAPDAPDAPDVHAVPRPDPQPSRSLHPDVEPLLSAGDFIQARSTAQAHGDRLGLARADLLLALTTTIEPGPFANPRARFREVRWEDRDDIAVQVNGALLLLDGRDLPADADRGELNADLARERLAANLRQQRLELGDAPSGLALHRLAYLSFSAGLRRLGAALLTEGLRSSEGPILVDMFADGDFDRLHWARKHLAGQDPGPEPSPGPSPEPSTRPERLPVDPNPEPAPSRPDPQPAPSRPDTPPIERDPIWVRAEAAYRLGLDLYRGAFGASVRAAAPSIRAAIESFREAQDLLGTLLDAYPDNHALDQRLVELNALVLDCTKRLGTSD